MNIDKLKAAVFEKTGIRLERHDPIFSLVALNEVVIADLLAISQEQWARNNAELDDKISTLTKIQEQMLIAARELASRVDQAHMAAALNAATEAKAEIFKSARDAVTVEVQKSISIIAEGAAQLDAIRKQAKPNTWAIAIVQTVISGMLAAMIVLGFTLYR
jgi:hypothetical protein